MKYDLIVIGGGPAGMIAAGRAGERGARVVLLEKNNHLGLKLLSTGHGRCNFTNRQADTKETINAYGGGYKFLFSVFDKFGVEDTIKFFANLGISAKTEDNGRVFPLSDKAGDVLRALTLYLEESGVKIKLGAEINAIKAGNDKIKKVLLKNGERIIGKNFLISTGGRSYPETGSTGDAYEWLAKLGHKIINPRPALAPIVVKEKIVKNLEGLSLKDIGINVYQNNKKIISRIGNIIFTADGISGPAILDLSSRFGLLLTSPTLIKIDFQPEIESVELEKQLQKNFHRSRNKIFKNYLSGIVPPKLVPVIIKHFRINGQKYVSAVTKEERQALASALKEFTFEVQGVKGFNKAMITAGGVDVNEIDPRTMRSKLFDNLFMAGEILNLDGPTGGYNLQICWSTGFVAGDSVPYMQLIKK